MKTQAAVQFDCFGNNCNNSDGIPYLYHHLRRLSLVLPANKTATLLFSPHKADLNHSNQFVFPQECSLILSSQLLEFISCSR